MTLTYEKYGNRIYLWFDKKKRKLIEIHLPHQKSHKAYFRIPTILLAACGWDNFGLSFKFLRFEFYIQFSFLKSE